MKKRTGLALAGGILEIIAGMNLLNLLYGLYIYFQKYQMVFQYTTGTC